MQPVYAVGLLLALLPASRGADDAVAIIERGIAAQGGPAAVEARATAEHFHSKGTVYVLQLGDDTPMSYAVSGGHYSEESGREGGTSRATSSDVMAEVTRVYNGKKAWWKINGTVNEEDAEQTAKDRMDTYHERIGKLHGLLENKTRGRGLLENKAFVFTALGESKVADKPVRGVRVSCKGHDDSLLYFDKATGLLVKHTHPCHEPDKDGKKVMMERYYSDYRKADFGAPAERVLEEYELETTSKSLLDLVRKRAPTPEAAKKAKEFVRQLGDDKFETREQASEGLIALGPLAVPSLQAARKDPDREVASRARRCLLRINPDRQERTLLAAVRLLGVRCVDGVCEPLLALLPGANDALRREVADSLYQLASKDGKHDPVLVAALKDKDPARRAAAEAALGKDGGKFAKQAGRRVYPRTLRYAMKIAVHMDGKKLSDSEITEVHFFNRLDDALFEKP